MEDRIDKTKEWQAASILRIKRTLSDFFDELPGYRPSHPEFKDAVTVLTVLVAKLQEENVGMLIREMDLLRDALTAASEKRLGAPYGYTTIKNDEYNGLQTEIAQLRTAAGFVRDGAGQWVKAKVKAKQAKAKAKQAK